MILTKGLTRLGLAAGLFAFVLGVSAAFASTTHAQNPPATFYGTAKAADKVEALIGGKSCGAAVTADATGAWLISIPDTAACTPTAGAAVSFNLNGAAATSANKETWKAGGAPVSAAAGVALTAGSAAPAAPAAPKTGNAGLLGDHSASTWLVVGLALFAVATVAGARTATRRGR